MKLTPVLSILACFGTAVLAFDSCGSVCDPGPDCPDCEAAQPACLAKCDSCSPANCPAYLLNFQAIPNCNVFKDPSNKARCENCRKRCCAGETCCPNDSYTCWH